MGGLASLFGGGSAPTLSFASAAPYQSALTSIAQNYGNQANQAQNVFNTNQGASQAATNQYAQYLSSNPATESYNAGQIAGAERGASEGATKAAANLDQSLAMRGISPSSSAGIGGLAQINAGLAANDATIQNSNAQNNIAQHAANLGTLANLLNGQTAQSFGQSQGIQSAQTGVNNTLLNNADMQSLDSYNAANEQYQDQQSGVNSLLGVLGNGAAAAFPKIGKAGATALQAL